MSIQDKYDELVERQLRNRPVYLCDCEKNAKCTKESCAALRPDDNPSDWCRLTLNIRYAKIDDDGNAIRIMSVKDL